MVDKDKTKIGQFSKVELCYIENNLDKGVATLAKDLGRSEASVQKRFDEFLKAASERRKGTIESKDSEKPESSMLQLMGRHKRNSKTVAAIMTQAASQLADETRSSRRSKKLESAIYKPLGDT